MGLLDRFKDISPLSKNFYGGAAGAQYRRQTEAYDRSLRQLRRKSRRGDVKAGLAEITVRDSAIEKGFTAGGGIRDADTQLFSAQKFSSDLERRAKDRGLAADIAAQRNREEAERLRGGGEEGGGGGLGAGLAPGDRAGGMLGGAQGDPAERPAGLSTGGLSGGLDDQQDRLGGSMGQPPDRRLNAQRDQGLGVDRTPSGAPAAGPVTGYPSEVSGRKRTETEFFNTPFEQGLLNREQGRREGNLDVADETATPEDLALAGRNRGMLGGGTVLGGAESAGLVTKRGTEGRSPDPGAKPPMAQIASEPFQAFTAAASDTQRSGPLSREKAADYKGQQQFDSASRKAQGEGIQSPAFRGIQEEVHKAMYRGEINGRYAAQYLADVAEVFKNYENMKRHGLTDRVPPPPNGDDIRSNPQALFEWVSQVNDQRLKLRRESAKEAPGPALGRLSSNVNAEKRTLLGR